MGDNEVRLLAVRPAGPQDAVALALAHVRAWQAAYAGLMPQSYLEGLDPVESADTWRLRLREPREGSRLLVGTVDEQVAGFASFGAARDQESGDGGELYALNVRPDQWRWGVGSVLLSAAHDGLADLGHHQAVLWVLPGNDRARRFYERRGWTDDELERTSERQGVTFAEIRYSRSVP